MSKQSKTFELVESRPNFPDLEQRVMEYWKKNNIPEKVGKARDAKKQKVYYDGPITANGLPHYGHVQTWTLKDIIPRYWTMKGHFVSRNIGWDCQGLPVEYEIEKQKKFTSKEDIEAFGIAKFNKLCRESVLKYRGRMIAYENRVGRWIDLNDQYSTMNSSYIESIWWSLKALYSKDLLYQGHKVVAYSTRAGTTLSSAEVTLGGYKEIVDPAVTVKFKINELENTYILAWTTTPWTLPGNLMLSIGKKIDYVRVEQNSTTYILAKEAVERVFAKSTETYRIVGSVSADQILKYTYQPLFPHFQQKKSVGAFRIIFAEHVTTEEGTGVVHLAPYGAEDFDIFMKMGIELFDYLDDTATFTDLIPEYKGMFYKKANKYILADLEKNNQLYYHEPYPHQMPMCWRTDTPLIYKPIKSWYLRVSKIKKSMLSENSKINWVPPHVRDGRFGSWLENARDWALSRNRYWGTPIPVWINDKTGEMVVIGSFEELEKLSGKKLGKDFDPHRPHVDDITWSGAEGGVFRRIPDVIDVWYDSGAMPFAQYHYPFANKKLFESRFPADYISESIDQTRGWFYTLLVVNVALFGTAPFQNAVMGGFMCDEKGQKFSKSKKNYPAIDEIFDTFGADVFRYFVLTSTLTRGENASFSERIARETQKEFFTTLWNSYRYFVTYANTHNFSPTNKKSTHVLDLWIEAKLQRLIHDVTLNLDSYEVMKAARLLSPFVNDLSTWYIRRSRDRFVSGDIEALSTLYRVLRDLSKVTAPFMPFVSEEIYRNLTQKESVHLEDYPEAHELTKVDTDILRDMEVVRRIVSAGNAERKKFSIGVRQPLQSVTVHQMTISAYKEELGSVIADELNVKEVLWVHDKDKEERVELDIKITTKLKEEGDARNLVRKIQNLRKKEGCLLDENIEIEAPEWPKKYEQYIQEKTLAQKITKGETLSIKRLH